MTSTNMSGTIALLAVVAALEMGSDAAIRHGLVRQGAWHWVALGMVLGAATLLGCGVAAHGSRVIDFGRLMGIYIPMSFVVSQVLAVTLFGERLAPSVILGGTLIVAGGIVIQLGIRVPPGLSPLYPPAGAGEVRFVAATPPMNDPTATSCNCGNRAAENEPAVAGTAVHVSADDAGSADVATIRPKSSRVPEQSLVGGPADSPAPAASFRLDPA